MIVDQFGRRISRGPRFESLALKAMAKALETFAKPTKNVWVDALIYNSKGIPFKTRGNEVIKFRRYSPVELHPKRDGWIDGGEGI